jgi:group I intron endonuclease
MEKYIYKLTNLINGKIYIGQTNNLERRLKEHLYDKRRNKPIHNALIKHGRENFSLEVIYYGENYNEEEKKWIAFYESNNKEKGYNIQEGGQDSSGENNPMAKITQEKAEEVIDLLLNTKLSYDEIAEKANLDKRYIQHINHGEAWSNIKYTYPLRKFLNKLTNEKVQEIISLLKDESKSIDDIVEITEVKRHTILNINKGKAYIQDSETYPIKELGLKKETLNKIIELLSTTDMYYREIADEVDVSLSIVANINVGESWYNENLSYPIRKATIVRNEHGQYDVEIHH